MATGQFAPMDSPEWWKWVCEQKKLHRPKLTRDGYITIAKSEHCVRKWPSEKFPWMRDALIIRDDL